MSKEYTPRSLLRVYLLCNSLFWFATALPIPFLVLFRRERGLSLSQIALVTGVYSLTVLVLEVPSGVMADLLGKKRITLWAYILIILAGLINMLSFSIGAFLAAGIIYGAGRALVSGALEAWFINSMGALEPDKDIHPHLAKSGVFEFGALALGSLAGGLIAHLLRFLPTGEGHILTPYAAVIGFSSLLHGANGVILYFLVRENPESTLSQGKRRNPRAAFGLTLEAVRESLSNRVLFLFLVLSLINGMVIMGLETYWQPYFSGMPGMDENRAFFFSFIMTGTYLAGIAGNSLAPPALRISRNSHLPVIIFSALLRILALIILSLSRSPWYGALIFLTLFFSIGLGGPSLSVLVNREIPDKLRASMLSVQSLFFFGGCLAGSAISGLILRFLTLARFWAVLAGLLILALSLYIPLSKALKRRIPHA